MQITRLVSPVFAILLLVPACGDVPGSTTDGASTSSSSSSDGSSGGPSTLDPTTTTSSTTSTTDVPTTSLGPTTSTSTSSSTSTTAEITGTSSTSGTTDSSTATDTDTDTDTLGTSTSTTGDPLPCELGEALCGCLEGACNSGAPCLLGECPPIGDCESQGNGFCEEPDLCAPGSDPFDCCATPQDGVCESIENGGVCITASDYWDCGACLWTDDGECDEGIYCPEGSDVNDCCATPGDGICEEESQGGMCPDGTDVADCGGECPWADDGVCDEPVLCPPGTDVNDCCATPGNGECEEESQGGMCPDGTDFYDCGYCKWPMDGLCDEPDFCPPDSDAFDCCATPNNGVCEEEGQGGECPDGSDILDCGGCPWTDDGVCDEPNDCPEGTDVNDCCATPKDGVCEEEGQGGECPDGTDFFDCGECKWVDDGECDEPDLCPPGSDTKDCE